MDRANQASDDDEPAENPENGGELNLKEAARRLGVHYMTAYRYVRQGRLEATRSGTEWRVPVEAIESFDRSRRGPAAPQEAGASGAGAPAAGSVSWDERLAPILATGDEAAAWRLIDDALGGGRDLSFCYFEMLAPALARIDADTDSGRAGPAMATVVAQRLVARLGATFRRPGRTRGDLVLGAPRGERHQLPLLMVADVLRAEGFGVRELGAGASPEAFVEAATAAPRLIAVGIGVTTAERLDETRATIAAVRTGVPGVPIVVGGQAVRNRDVADLVGADHWAADGPQTVQVLARLCTTRRPARAGSERSR